MIDRLIELSLKHRFLVLAGYVLLALGGYWALLETPVDAIPDLSENQVIVFSEWPGRSPQEVEDQVTYPLTLNLQGLAGVRTVRSSSAFGLSIVTVIFEDDVEIYFARTRILERLARSLDFLPEGASPGLGPDATSVGQILWYTVEGPYDPTTLRSVQDWFVRHQLNSVQGVAEVASIGGFVRQYQIDLDPLKLRSHNISIRTVLEGIERSNSNVGGKVVEANDREYVVRGVGLIRSLTDIEDIVLTSRRGVPIHVREVATVQLGPEFRRGVLDKNGSEVVGGVVVMRYGANAREVIRDIKAKMTAIKSGLPEGVTLTPFYDRSILIDRAEKSLQLVLIEEILFVTILQVVFFWHLRSILVVTVPLPLAVLTSFLLMRCFGVSSNIMSLGGIAIAIGVLVDAGIVVTENVMRHAEKAEVRHPDGIAFQTMILKAVHLVGRPIFLSMAVMILACTPVFALTGMEAKLFHPLALTKTFAMVGAAVIAITLVPVLCTLLIRGKIRSEADNPVMRLLYSVYRPTLRFALAHRVGVLLGAAVLFGSALAVSATIGSEFMPPLDEETAMWMPIADPSISLTKASELLREQDRIIAADPAVEMAVGKVGRAETSTDPAPINMTETIIVFKPTHEWPEGDTKAGIIERLDAKLRTPGITGIWTQPIQNRVDMLSTGIRTQVGVKIFGKDLGTIEKKALEIEQVLRDVPGAADLYAERFIGTPYLEIKVDRQALARLGIAVQDVQDVIETAIGGRNVTFTVEGRERYAVQVRYARDYRESVDSLARVFVSGAEGTQLALGEVAQIQTVMGPSMISSENGLLRGSVIMNVRGRDVGGFVEEAKRVVSERVPMPVGYYLEWSGQYENQTRARQRLLWVVPAAVLIILALLYMVYRSTTDALHVLLAIPFSLTGGVFLLKILDYNFSVAVWIGFIALFGTAVQTSVVMVVYLEEAFRRRVQAGGLYSKEIIQDAVLEGALLRLRPKVMTVATVIAGLLPIMWSTRTGTEIMKPIAAPVLGGMISSLFHVLIVTPVIFALLKERALRRGARSIEYL
jgi:Cu(I)/Ag(I) efflux system membrane protein CusA/SilA